MKKITIAFFMFIAFQANAQSNQTLPKQDSVYIMVDEKPQFPGGELAMIKYLDEKKGYPAMAREQNIEGTIWVSFIVEKDGSISNAMVRKDATSGGGLKEAALKAVQSMNTMETKWTPGKVKGVNVRTSLTIPLKYKLKQS